METWIRWEPVLLLATLLYRQNRALKVGKGAFFLPLHLVLFAAGAYFISHVGWDPVGAVGHSMFAVFCLGLWFAKDPPKSEGQSVG